MRESREIYNLSGRAGLLDFYSTTDTYSVVRTIGRAMTCYNPIKAFVLGYKPDGKAILKFTNKEQRDLDVLWHNGKLYTEYVLLPCGKCLGCTIKRSREWATRICLELKYHERACFITLTYNDENLPTTSYVDDNGEEKLSFTLKKKDFQDFMKRLRKHYSPEKIRFFACGEYGDRTHRPHYHAILFGVDFSEDRYIWKKSDDGFVEYRSPTLEKLWKFGYSEIAEVNWNTAAYVSRYCTKKYAAKQNIHYQTLNIEPEFNLMSRRPGIGREYFDENHDEVYINQFLYLSNIKGGFKIRPPSYFDRLKEELEPDYMKDLKRKRKEFAEEQQKLILSKTDLDWFQYLKVQEEDFKSRLATLRRDKI